MEPNKKAGLESLGNVDQIREILFGTQFKELSTRLEQLERHVQNVESQIQVSLSELKTDLHERLENELEGVRKRLKQNVSQIQDQLNDAGEQAVRLERRLQTTLDNRSQELEEAIGTNKTLISGNAEEVRKMLASVEENLRNEITQMLSGMEDTKTSKAMLSSLLMDMAMKLQNVSLDVVTETSDQGA